MSRDQSRGLLPEWAPQSAILLTWPRSAGDFADHIQAVEACYSRILVEICRDQQAVVLVEDAAAKQRIRFRLRQAGASQKNLHLIQIRNDDVWVRDYGPLSVVNNGQIEWVNFRFDGWGGKFSARQDDVVTRQLNTQPVFSQMGLTRLSMVAEGGALETDGKGTLMATASSLWCTRRNPVGSRARLQQILRNQLGLQHWLILQNGHLEGDDTDGHIDTLARFVGDRHIIFQGCDDPKDSHYEPLQKMKSELRSYRRPGGGRYRLTELPMPVAQYATDGHRLPASYANYLVTNQSVLMPTYADAADEAALSLIKACFPSRRVVGIDCRTLIQQHGSLHCATMQLHHNFQS